MRTGLLLEKVSPNSINTWCSLTAVFGSSLIPLSHMIPRSVPPTPKRVCVLLRPPGPVTFVIIDVFGLTATGVTT